MTQAKRRADIEGNRKSVKPQLTYKQRLEVGAALAPLLRDEPSRRVKLVDATGAVIGERTIQVGRAVLAKAAIAFGTGDERRGVGVCLDCGKSITSRARRCRSCHGRTRTKPIPLNCLDCGKKLHRRARFYGTTRCRPCLVKATQKPAVLCVECGTALTRDARVTRCLTCHIKRVRKPPALCIDCGVALNMNARNTGTKRCRSCASKKRWTK